MRIRRSRAPVVRSALCVVLLVLMTTVQLAAAPTQAPRPRVELLGEVRLTTGTIFDGVEVGGLSGLTYDAENEVYYAISDDRSWRGPARFFTLTIDLADGRLDEGDLALVARTTILDRDGQSFARGEVDAEGIALAGDGSLYISSEGDVVLNVAPFVRRFSVGGRFLGELALPDHYLPAAGVERGIRANLGFEGLGIAPGWATLFTACENALVQDGPVAGLAAGAETRILEFDLVARRAVREYVYPVDPVPEVPEPAEAYHENGVSEVLVLDGRLLVVVERSFSAGKGNSVRLYRVALENATNVLDHSSLTEVDRDRLRPAKKQLLCDLADLGVEADNIEGITVGPSLADGRRTLVLVSDNNFKGVQTSQFVVLAVQGLEPELLPAVLIHQIQGRAHQSPLKDEWVDRVRGVITAVYKGRNGGSVLWLQEPENDSDPATSHAIKVACGPNLPEVAVGDEVLVSGRVEERGFPGELTVTRITASKLLLLASGQPLPAVVTLGAGGRSLPTEVIDDDRMSSFDPDDDAIDFFESLEGMRVRVEQPLVVGPTSPHGVITVLADAGNGFSPLTERGALVATDGDLNPERLLIDDRIVSDEPDVALGARFSESVVGVLDYAYGSYRIYNVGDLPEVIDGEIEPEITDLRAGEQQLTVATFNVENLAFTSSAQHFAGVAEVVAGRMAGPDIIALQEIQDDSGRRDDGVVSAERTLGRLAESIHAAGGPHYEWRQVDPEDGKDGGAPGANIRVAFLFNPRRVDFVDRGDGGPALWEAGPRLSCSPGRLAADDPAFAGSPEQDLHGTRKPLAGEFLFAGRRLFIINNHLSSKIGDDQPFGAHQPPIARTGMQRSAQARVLGDFVQQILTLDADARVIVLGDFNDFEYRSPLRALVDSGLENLVQRLPRADRYTYIYQGNGQAIDHILVSPSLAAAAEVDVVHVSSEQPSRQRASDHDPVVARFSFD